MARKGVFWDERERQILRVKKGLWADPQPVPPWEWREGVR